MAKTENDLLFAKNAEDKGLARIGIPRRFWGRKLEDFSFRQAEMYSQKLSPVAQRQWIKSLLKYPYLRNRLVVASSDPTDEAALALGSFLMQDVASRGMEVAMSEVNNISYLSKFPRFIVLHNILRTATPERLQQTRDALLRFKGAFRFLVVAKDANPFKFCVGKLGLYPDIVFYLKDERPQ